MDEALKESARQVPSLTVLVVLVVYFLRALDRRDQTIRAMGDRWNKETAGRVQLRIYAGGVAGDEGAKHPKAP